MKTVIVGGGRGCLAILELLNAGQLRELNIELACVVDVRGDAPGMVVAALAGGVYFYVGWRKATRVVQADESAVEGEL